MAEPAPLVCLFGVPALRLPTGEDHLLGADRPHQLLALLAARADWAARAELAAWLWPERATAAARSNLRMVLLRAQQIVGAVGLPAVETRADLLRWSPDCDLRRFERACDEQRAADALALFRGTLLQAMEPGLAAPALDWLEFERARLARRWRAQAALRLQQLEHAPAEAAALASALLEADAGDEAAAVALARAHLRRGHAEAALAALHSYRRHLADELGVEPPALLRDLEEQARGALRRGDSAQTVAGAASPAPASVAPDFVGRRLELAQLRDWLLREHRRVIAITGPGGVGKSRLGRALLASVSAHYGSRAWCLGLADLHDIDALPLRLATALGMPSPDPAGGGAWQRIERHIGAAPALLLVDDGDRLAGLPQRLDALLGACDGLQIVSASRGRLHLAGEWLLPLDGLPLPDADELDADLLRLNDAVGLFEQRARASAPHFVLAQQAAAVVRFVHGVEGLPLAIELGAALARLLPVDAILQELVRAAGAAAPGTPASPIVASFDLSWQRLSAGERRALAQLAQLPGDFDHALAGSVAGAPLPVLSALVDKSLVRADGSGRFSLHPLLRSCALGRQEQAGVDPEALAARHAAYVAHWLQPFESRYSLQGRAAAALLEPMLPHLRAAWRWAIQRRDAPLAMRFAAIASEYFRLRGLWREGITLLQQAVAAFAADDTAAVRVRVRSMVELGVLQYHGSNIVEAEATLRAALRLAAAVRDSSVLARGLMNLGNCMLDLGRNAEAQRCFERARRQAERDGAAQLVAVSRLCLGTVAAIAGQLGDAAAHYEAAEPQLAAGGNHDAQAAAIINLGHLDFQRGDFDAALLAFERAREVCDRHDLASTRPYALVNIALTLAELGRHHDAAQGFERALHEARAHGEPMVEAHALLGMARGALAVGRHAQALDQLRSALAVAQAAGLQVVRLACALLWAEWLAARGSVGAARDIMGWLAQCAEAEPRDRDRAARWLAQRAPDEVAFHDVDLAEVERSILGQGSGESTANHAPQ